MKFLPADGRLAELIGQRDISNRYASTVMVEVDEPTSEHSCSGVLVAPRMVLTAGHCVCAWRRAPLPEGREAVHIDGAACAKQARVTTMLSAPTKEPSTSVMQTHSYVGQVRPHPELEIDLDAQNAVVASRADLAVILLETAVKRDVPLARLAETEARNDELLVLASYGYEAGVTREYGTRFFKQGKVKDSSAALRGRVLYEPQGLYFNTGYRGGPCLREGKKGPELIGVVGLGTDAEMNCTSTSFHQDWLRAELQHGAAAGPAVPHGP